MKARLFIHKDAVPAFDDNNTIDVTNLKGVEPDNTDLFVDFDWDTCRVSLNKRYLISFNITGEDNQEEVPF